MKIATTSGIMIAVIKNASEKPKVFYGLHFCPGVAEYAEPDAKPYRIFLNEQTIREMDPTFAGCPLYVGHVEDVDLKNLEQQADGYVVESFFNEADGKHWCKFIVVSDKGHQAIRNGWRLSNAYVPEAFAQGGLWNGVEYQKEVTRAKYEHLALVPDPRYAESIVLTPEAFQSYNCERIMAMKKIANSQEKLETGKVASIFKLFKKTPVEDTKDFESAVVTLKNGKEMTLADLVKNAEEMEYEHEKKHEEEAHEHKKENSDASEEDEHHEEKDPAGDKESRAEEKKHGREEEDEHEHEAPQMANMDHHVMVGNESKPLHEVMKDHMHMHHMMSSLAAHHHTMSNLSDSELDGGERDEEKTGGAEDADLTKRNADEDGGEKESVAQLKEADKTKRNSNFKALADAPSRMLADQNVDQLEQLDRGRNRYGSGR